MKLEDQKSQEAITEAERRVEVISGREQDAAARLERLETSIKDQITQRDQLSTSIKDAKLTLKSFQDDINMFPSEIKGYVSQATNNARLYGWLSVIPMCVIVVMGIRLISSAEELVRNVNSDANINVFEILISRLPYVTVSVTIFAMMVGVLSFLLTEIVNINRRKQELYKINIIATDIVNSNSTNTDVIEEEKLYQLNVLKMEMLRDHLKHTLSDDFQLKFNPLNFRRNSRELDKYDINNLESQNLDEKKSVETSEKNVKTEA